MFFRIPGTKILYLRIYNKLKFSIFSSQIKTIVSKNKFKLIVNLEDWIQNQIYFLGSYENFELCFLEESLNKGDTFIDIGANFGLYSLNASCLVGDFGKVLAFEPFSENYKAFKDNIELNDFKNVTLIKQAIGKCREEVQLSYHQKDRNLGMVSIFQNDFTEQETVVSDSLDNYLLSNNLNSVNYIKIDIEGAEYPALLGMMGTIEKYKPIIQIEIDDNILANTPYRSCDIYKFMDPKLFSNHEFFFESKNLSAIKKIICGYFQFFRG